MQLLIAFVKAVASIVGVLAFITLIGWLLWVTQGLIILVAGLLVLIAYLTYGFYTNWGEED